MKKIISKRPLLLLIMSMLVSASAFSAVTAESILSDISSKMSTQPSLSVKFHFSTSKGNISGTMIVAKEKFKFQTPQMSVWYNGRDMWSLNPDTKEVNLTTPTAGELCEINPLDIIRGYKKDYTVALQGNANGQYSILFTAKQKNSETKSAVLVVDQKTKNPVTLTINFKNNTRLIANVESVSTGAKPGPLSFDFPKTQYKGYEVIDLR
jgi:outer membrane lipoprotein-sorting protein